MVEILIKAWRVKMKNLEGKSFTFSWKIDSEEFLWRSNEEVFSLHLLATSGMMEIVFRASFNLLKPMMEPGVTTVVSWASVEHLSPVPYGATIHGKFYIEKATDRYLDFLCEIYDHLEKVGVIRFRRVLVSLNYLRRKANEKTAEL